MESMKGGSASTGMEGAPFATAGPRWRARGSSRPVHHRPRQKCWVHRPPLVSIWTLVSANRIRRSSVIAGMAHNG